MAKAVYLRAPGDTSMFEWKDASIPEPQENEILIRHTAIGLNYIDVYHRTGLYPLESYPAILGVEGCGEVIQCGEKVEFFQPGMQVAYAGPTGAYSQYRVLKAEKAVRIPEGINHQQVAGIFLKGLTAFMLVRKTFRVFPESTILVHAAAGGVGNIVCQWAKQLGATVIGTVGSPSKKEFALHAGCDHVIDYTNTHWLEQVKEITQGKGVNAVYDAIGRATLENSLKCLKHLGILVSYGQASGAALPIDPLDLMRGGSLFLTRPRIHDYLDTHEELTAAAAELFSLMQSGHLQAYIGQSFYLSDIATAHHNLEARKTLGSTILIPE
jgi:NADPH2:quinone reductase